MDYNFITYFISIIENDFNITKAAKSLHLSQPALSKSIKRFEEEYNLLLFQRKKGRLTGLTSAGELLLEKGEQLVIDYNQLIDSLMLETNAIKGNINIGISPVIISVLFPTLLPEFIRENPSVILNITEAGAVELKEQLINDQLDIVTLLTPSGLNQQEYEQVLLSKDELAVFMDKKNPLASNQSIKWEDFKDQPIAIFNDTYMINRQISNYLREHSIYPHYQLKSDSWDLLLNSTRNSNLLTILPKPICKIHNMDNIVTVDFHDDISWEIILARPKKRVYSNVENYVFEYFINYFKQAN